MSVKEISLSLFALLFVLGFSFAQSVDESIDQAEDLAKDGKKALQSFYLDTNNNKSKLQEAKDNVDKAVALVKDVSADALKSAYAKEKDVDKAKSKLATVWNTQGEVYNEIGTQIITAKQLNFSTDELPKAENPVLTAAEAYTKGLAMSVKKFQSKEAVKGLEIAQGNLSNFGIYAYESQDYESAYSDFDQALKVHDLLKENGGNSVLANEDDYNNQMYITGLAALSADKANLAKPMFEKLYQMEFDKPAIYEALYKIEAEGDREAAFKYLETGRNKYPDDVSLLFAEINHYLAINKLDVLISKLENAIQKEPNNIGLYSTMGNVYDNLYQKASSEGDQTKAKELFDNALKYYNQALEKKPDFFDAIYSIGALYYNRAAALTQEMNELANDFSKEGLKKYEAKKAAVFEQFDEALPFFKRAEKLNPSDLNTLIALKEIYARKDDLPTSNVFKERLEKVQAGGTVEASYFNE